jgi:periplasmic divalent cation tolerance protein
MYATVFVTVPSEATAESIGKYLVENRMAACANFFPCRSIYRWKGQIEGGSEFVLLLKIRSSDFRKVTEAILSMHPDEVPCIVMEEIGEGYRPYLDWLRELTERPLED